MPEIPFSKSESSCDLTRNEKLTDPMEQRFRFQYPARRRHRPPEAEVSKKWRELDGKRRESSTPEVNQDGGTSARSIFP